MKTWRTKEGKTLKISEMETSHIENCIRMLEKKIENGDVIQKYGGGSDGDYWYDEEDLNEQYEQDIKDFKLEILWRERK